jgi:hypothetical protein
MGKNDEPMSYKNNDTAGWLIQKARACTATTMTAMLSDGDNISSAPRPCFDATCGVH